MHKFYTITRQNFIEEERLYQQSNHKLIILSLGLAKYFGLNQSNIRPLIQDK